MSPLIHQPGSDDHAAGIRPAGIEGNILTSAALRPAGVHEDTARVKVDPSDASPAVKKAAAKLAKMEEAQAPASVITRCRQKLADARTDWFESVAELRHKERTRVLADQKEKIRQQHENEILFRVSALVPVLSLTVDGLEIVTRPERAPDSALRQTAYSDFHAVSVYVANMTAKAAGAARVASKPLDAFPIDPDYLRRQVRDIMHRSIRSGLTELIEVSVH